MHDEAKAYIGEDSPELAMAEPGGANVSVREGNSGDRGEWLRMRTMLFPDCPSEQNEREMDACLASDSDAIFVAQRTSGGLCGFVEASVRPWAVNCEAMPVGYLESWYVDADSRRQGIGRALVHAAECWARSKGCRQMASDAELLNITSQQAHVRLGYEETMRLVLYKKDLV
ncbi:MAG TPA: GNAT family N-acetyltransferase [Pirellulales bacterium]|nr:GNAT family N-acetyltransferase [Pirellulales bacterium]